MDAAIAACAVGRRRMKALQKARLRLRSSGLSTITAVGMGARKVDGSASCVAKLARGDAAPELAAGRAPVPHPVRRIPQVTRRSTEP